MAKGRMLNKKISLNRDVNSLSGDTSRLAFTWTIAHLDKEGRIHGDPLILKSIVFPRRTDITTAMMRSFVIEWVRNGLVVWYEVKNELWLEFPKFKDNQPGLRGEREAESPFPAPNQGKRVMLDQDPPLGDATETVITTDKILRNYDDIPELLRSIDIVGPDKLRSNSGPTPEDCRINSGVTPQDNQNSRGVTEFNLTEFNIPPPAVSLPKTDQDNKDTPAEKESVPKKAEPPPASAPAAKPLTAFDLFCRINDWISETDGLYETVEKPGDGAKEWGFLKRMAAKIRSPDLVYEVLDMLHEKGKIKGGFMTSWMAKEIEQCIEELDREARNWD